MDDYSEPLDLSLPSVKLKNRQSLSDLPLDLSKKRIDNPQLQLGPFSNSIIRNIPNLNCDKRSRVHQSSGPSSLPYLNQSKPRKAHSCVPIRNPYEDDLENEETPFNFGCRYSETKLIDNRKSVKDTKTKNGNYTIYAETDLDQPTDYSLRYAENNRESDGEVSEESENEEKTAPVEFVGDCVKTYCTEGTPYETPFNFSTSTSMSDLRIGDKGRADVMENTGEKFKIKERIPENEVNDKKSKRELKEQPVKLKSKNEFNSGLTSPEKPMNYCEEGTPGYFSRVSSFSSLNSAEKLSEDKDKGKDRLKGAKSEKMVKMTGSEGKVVKFENIVNYCEETPLMFSRSSSLGSLDSIEQSMQDDRSSVISDFSRLTSGIISPSEIPDSPTQTVPSSPKRRKSGDFGLANRRSSIRRSLPTKSSIFEDDVTKFKEENTPVQFSIATSLSSLTIDDQDQSQNRDNSNVNEVNVDKNSLNGNEGIPFQRENVRSNYNQMFSLPPPLSSENNLRTYNTEDTPAVLSRNGSISDLSMSTLSILEEENVDEKRNDSVTEDRNKIFNRQIDNLPPFLESRDECSKFAVEDSPVQFSLRSSLSRLTMESEGNCFNFSVPTVEEPAEETKENIAEIEEIKKENVTVDLNEEEEHTVPNENSKSDLKSDDSRCNSMKKRKWKWKWQFNNEDGQNSESGDSSLTDKQSSTNTEEFDHFKRGRGDKGGGLDASLRKKKWWKWKFGSKDKEDCSVQEEVEEKEATSLDTRNKSKRWKWKWKLGFKDDFSKSKHQVSPEITKEPKKIDDVMELPNVPKEIKFLPEKKAEVLRGDEEIGRIEKEKVVVAVREKLATPEPSDSDRSLVVEEIDSSDDQTSKNRNKSNGGNEMKEKLNNGTVTFDEGKKIDYGISLEECIQMGMPKKKTNQSRVVCRLPSPSSSFSNSTTKQNGNDELKNFLEECIQQGMPGTKVQSEKNFCRISPKKTCETGMNRSNPNYQALRNATKTNYESSSLNRFPLDKARKKVFNSNDDILTNVSNQIAQKSKAPSTNERDRYRTNGQLTNGKVGQKEIFNSQLNRTVSKILDTSSSSSRSVKSGSHPDYETLIEECIQLGMPKRKETPKEIVRQKTLDTKRWPEYLSKIANENKSASLPKNHFNSAQTKRDPVLQRALERNRNGSNDDETERITSKSSGKATTGSSYVNAADDDAGNYFSCESLQTERAPPPKLGVPLKRLQEIRRSLERNGTENEAESEDNEAVYANTTERYSTFNNQTKQEDDKISRVKSYEVRGSSVSPIGVVSDRKPAQSVASNKTYKDVKIPRKSEDFAAIIEECIQLGMPKRKEDVLNSCLSLSSNNSRSKSAARCGDYPSNKGAVLDSRSSTLPKGASRNSYSTNEERKKVPYRQIGDGNSTDAAQRVLKLLRLSPHLDAASFQPVRAPTSNSTISESLSDLLQKEEEMEESLYVNVSKHAGYSRSVSRQSPSLETMNSDKFRRFGEKESFLEPDYSDVLEECIKLGMPAGRKRGYRKNRETSENSIRFGSPSSVDSEEMRLYVNANVKDSALERETERLSRVAVPFNSLRNAGMEKMTVCQPSSTIEKALEECIQLGWPKRREGGKDPPPPKFYNPPYSDPMAKKTEKTTSKNVNVASVVRNMQRDQLACSNRPTTTGADLERRNETDEEETLTLDKKNGFDIENNQAESEMSFARLSDVDVRLLDPQLVLQSLEKYTAKLISEAEVIIRSKSVTA